MTVRALFRPALAALAAAGAVVLALAGTGPRPVAIGRVAALLDSTERSVLWGVVVADARTGEVLLERHPTRPMLPASNQKVLTAALALDRLGAAYRYRTPLLFDGAAEAGREGTRLRGTFAIVGQGDPSFGSSEVDAPDPLEAWAAALRARGIVRLEGTLVGDDDRFSDHPYAEGWDVDYLTTQADRYLGVPVSALSYRDNLVTVRLGPGPADVETDPPGALVVQRRDRTVDRTRGLGTGLRRLPGTGIVEITGTVREREAPLELPVDDPTRFVLDAFVRRLALAGIDATALRPVDVDALDEAPDWEGFDTLAVHTSPPLAALLEVMGTRSSNFYAEQIFRTAAPRGDVASGRAELRRLMAAQGDSTGLAVYDGSGLSRKNLVTARMLARTLVALRRRPDVDAFFRTLPYPGQPGGTLEYRLDGVPVRAKTGSLSHARALSGYVRGAGGRDYAFAILANNYTASDARIVALVDRMVRTLAQ